MSLDSFTSTSAQSNNHDLLLFNWSTVIVWKSYGIKKHNLSSRSILRFCWGLQWPFIGQLLHGGFRKISKYYQIICINLQYTHTPQKTVWNAINSIKIHMYHAFTCTHLTCGHWTYDSMVASHGKKFLGSAVGLSPFCVQFSASPHIWVGFILPSKNYVLYVLLIFCQGPWPMQCHAVSKHWCGL